MPNPIKKKIIDIARPVSVKQTPIQPTPIKPAPVQPAPVQPKFQKPELKKFEKDIKKIDEQIEQFEKKEEKQFKEEISAKKKRKLSLRTYTLYGLLIIILGLGVYAAIELLPRARVQVVTKKSDWSLVDSVLADKNIAKIDTNQKQIPAEVFTTPLKNFNFSFPATGKKMVQDKASGKITIYNAYSSNPQTLVANTSFTTSDNKIFHLSQKITVPGAQIIEAKIIPSSIEATIIADKPGSEYNIASSTHLSLPLFEGSAKYTGFYAQAKESIAEGFVGEVPVPTDNDIKYAKDKSEKDLKDYTDSLLSLQIPQEFKLIDGARQFNITKEEVNKKVDEKGNFTVFLEGKSSAIGFKESDSKDLIENLGQISLGESFKLKTYQLDYGAGRSDFNSGKISFAINFNGVFEEPLNIQSFEQKILGKNEQELKTAIYSLANIEKASVSFWPFWVKTVPDDLGRVKVEVE